MGGIGGRGELKWRQLAHHQLMSQQGPYFSPHSKAKANYKSINLRKNGIYGISDVVTASVYSEKTHLKKLMKMKIIIIIIITEKRFTSK